MKREWKRNSLGEVYRTTGDGALVKRRPAWDGGVRIVVHRPQDGMFFVTHSRRWETQR